MFDIGYLRPPGVGVRGASHDRASTDVRLTGVIGHRQVTDAYLAQLARSRSGRLATFDQGLAQLHPDVAQLVPTS